MARRAETATKRRRANSDLQAGQHLVLRIERLAAGGDGVAKAPDGRTVFVPLAAPGDTVTAEVTEIHRRFLRAEILKIETPGAARVEAPCSVFGVCGGCSWQHLEYSAQVEAKRSILGDALRRIGGHALAQEPAFMPSPQPYGYRARARLLAARGESGFRARRSHQLCATKSCGVLVPPLDAALDTLSRRSVGDRELFEWEMALDARGGVRLSRKGEKADEAVFLRVAGDEIRLSPGTFAQANALLWNALHDRVLSSVGAGDRAVELYAGAGFFTLGLARCFTRVTAIESSDSAVSDLRRNLDRAGLQNVEVVASRVEAASPGSIGQSPDVILLDPPRAGLPEAVTRALAGSGASRIVYVSCDPATLARDIARLADSGYKLVSVEGFDLFPQTPHLEAMAVLDRSTPRTRDD